MKGKDAPTNFKGTLKGLSKYVLGGDGDVVSVTVNNVQVDTKIHNVFGVIKGFVDPGELPAQVYCVSLNTVVCAVSSRGCFCRSLRGDRCSERLLQLGLRQVHCRHLPAGGARQSHHGDEER